MMNNLSNFVPQNGVAYRIISPAKPTKAWTLTQANTIDLAEYTGSPNQQFLIYQNEKKVAFVNRSNNQALIVEGHSQNDQVKIKSDPGQHPSNWFQISPCNHGQYANKSVNIWTFAYGKLCDIAGGLNGTYIQQYSTNKTDAQAFLILPADQQFQSNNLPQVPPVFAPSSGIQYKILNAEQTTKGFSVDKVTKNLNYAAYTGDTNQKFTIFQNGTKLAFVDQFTNTGLYVENNRHDQYARIKADPTQHPTSWVEIVRATSGQYANVSYVFKTVSGNVYDISGGLNGTFFHQWGLNH